MDAWSERAFIVSESSATQNGMVCTPLNFENIRHLRRGLCLTLIHKEIVGYQFYFFSVYDFVCSSSLSWDIVRIFWEKIARKC